jgi:hypothetical protein
MVGNPEVTEAGGPGSFSLLFQVAKGHGMMPLQ